MPQIVIICPEFNRGRWQVNLTDGCDVYYRRHFTDPRRALAYVCDWLAHGCRPAFASALTDLLMAATSRPTPPEVA